MPQSDYVTAAESDAASNLELIQYVTDANNVNQVTPYGSLTYTNDPTPIFDEAGFNEANETWGNWTTFQNSWNQLPDFVQQQNQGQYNAALDEYFGGTAPLSAPTEAGFTTLDDNWTATTELSGAGQELFDLNNETQITLGNLGLTQLGTASDLFSTRYESGLDPMGGFGDNRQSVMDAMLSRVNTDDTRDRDMTRSRLIAQGIPEGSEAFNRQMEQHDRRLTDARQQAEIAATGQAVTEQNADIDSRRQHINELLTERQTPLNEISAFNSGSQVTQPTWAPTTQMPYIPGTDYSGALNAQNNWDLGILNNDTAQNNALWGFGGDVIGGALSG